MNPSRQHFQSEEPERGNRAIPHFPETPIIQFPESRTHFNSILSTSGTIDTNSLTVGGQPNMEISTLLWQQLLQLTANIHSATNISDDDDWTLDADQALFMLQNNNLIELALATGDMSQLDMLVESEEFKAVFQDMSFDEAYDRYLTMLEEGRG